MLTGVAFVSALLLFLICHYGTAIPDSGGVICRQEEKEALLDFKLSFTADPNDTLSDWTTHNPDCCHWAGVDCNEDTGHVVELRVSGSLKSVQLRPSLLALPELTYLDLKNNNFMMRIPEFIGSLANLTALDLSYSGFYGMIPPQLGNLTGLEELHLQSGDSSHGLLYAHDLKWLLHLSLMEHLNLGGVNLSNATDWVSTLKTLPSLSYFGCSSCSLPSLPSPLSSACLLNHSASLLNLHSVLQHLPARLSTLDLSHNSFNEVISDSHFSKLSELRFLDLSNNYLLTFNFSPSWVPPFQLYDLRLASCKLGPLFPNWILTQKDLNRLDISNASISDAIPNAFWNASIGSVFLKASNNKLHGTLPNMSAFESYSYGFLDLSSNDFHGPIPLFIFSPYILDLSYNKFSSLPPLFIFSTFNVEINLSNNLLSGKLPNWIFEFDDLGILNLAYNKLYGSIPTNIAPSSGLTALHLNNNMLFGELPSSMKNYTRLLILELGNNNFSGSFPFWLGDNLHRLIVLNLRSNNLSGELPSNLCNLQRLQVLDLSSNRLSGSIPGCVNNFTSMTVSQGFNFISTGSLSLSYTKIGGEREIFDSASVTWKGILANESSSILPQLNVIDLSGNCLTGNIPSSFTSLKYLKSLDLSSNNLNGSIPDKIGNFTYMEVLKLSCNKLSGVIPQSLADLTFMNTLNLSSNNLCGEIPKSTQLQNLDPSSYGVNPELCGLPLPSKCPWDKDTVKPPPSMRDHPEEAHENIDIQVFYAALGA